MSRAVMQQALEALQERYVGALRDRAIEALEQALAEPEQEPVAWIFVDDTGMKFVSVDRPHKDFQPLYTAPTPQRMAVKLTDEEIDAYTMAIRNAHPLIVTPFDAWCRHFSRAVIAAYEAKQGEQT